MYTVRVTQLEKFRRYMDSVSPFDTEQSVIDTLSGEFKGNEYTWIGTAFHKIVEEGEKAWENGMVRTGGGDVKMNESQKNVAMAYRNSMPEAFHETRLNKVFQTRFGEVDISGCADIIHGNVIHDIKTKYSSPNQQEYIDSCQWRFYLEIFDANQFVFDLFHFMNYKKEVNGFDVSGLQLKVIEPIPCLRYEKMETDNRILLEDFMDWINTKQLYHLLNFKQNG